jgi:hypothetical protein
MAKKDQAIKKAMGKEKVDEADDEIENDLEKTEKAAEVLDDLTAKEEEPAEEPVAEPAPEMGGEEMPMDGAPEGEDMGMPTADDPLAGVGDGMDMGGEMPDADVDVDIDAEVPAEEPAPEGGEEGKTPADEETKNELKSLAGETGELARDKEFSDDEVVELVNQFVEPFDTEELSHNDQLKIQNKITGDEGTGEDLPPVSPEAGEEGEEEVSADIEIPAEEPVEEPMGESEGEEMCAECGTFEGYAKSRGYENLQECGGMELANLISGYANAHDEGMNDGDFPAIAILLTPEIKDELAGYGHDDFIAKAEEMGGEVSDEEKLSPGSFDVDVPAEPEMSDDEEEGEEGEPEELDEFGWRDIKNVGAGIAGVGQKAGQKVADKATQAQQKVAGAMQKGVEKVKGAAQQAGQYVGDKAKGVKQTYHKNVANRIVNDINQDATKLGQTIANFNAQAQKAGQQPISPQSIIMKMMSQLKQGGQTGFQHKFESIGEGGEDFASMASDVDMENPDQFNDDLKQATFAPVGENLGVATPSMGTTSLSEGEIKIRNYVKNRLAELAGKKKQTISESKKPASLKKLDKMISEQWELYQKQLKKK